MDKWVDIVIQIIQLICNRKQLPLSSVTASLHDSVEKNTLAMLKDVFWFMLKRIHTEECQLPFKANFENRSVAGGHAQNVMIIAIYYTEKCITGSRTANDLWIFASTFSPGWTEYRDINNVLLATSCLLATGCDFSPPLPCHAIPQAYAVTVTTISGESYETFFFIYLQRIRISLWELKTLEGWTTCNSMNPLHHCWPMEEENTLLVKH